MIPAMLASRFAMRVVWGPEYIMLYNDAYLPVLGKDKHPRAMGAPTGESFPELWHIVGPMFQRVYRGEAVALTDSHLPLHRNGYLEECYFTLSYSPMRDDAGAIAGLLGVISETTERVLAERRLRTLRALAAYAASAASGSVTEAAVGAVADAGRGQVGRPVRPPVPGPVRRGDSPSRGGRRAGRRQHRGARSHSAGRPGGCLAAGRGATRRSAGQHAAREVRRTCPAGSGRNRAGWRSWCRWGGREFPRSWWSAPARGARSIRRTPTFWTWRRTRWGRSWRRHAPTPRIGAAPSARGCGLTWGLR